LGIQHIDGPLLVKYWGVRIRATPEALTSKVGNQRVEKKIRGYTKGFDAACTPPRPA